MSVRTGLINDARSGQVHQQLQRVENRRRIRCVRTERKPELIQQLWGPGGGQTDGSVSLRVRERAGSNECERVRSELRERAGSNECERVRSELRERAGSNECERVRSELHLASHPT